VITINSTDVSLALRAIGIGPGDAALVHSDISRIGWMTGSRARMEVLQAYHDAIFDVIGPDGTIATLSCTESYARESRPYDHDTSRSEQGNFSEFIRSLPNAVRSMHPLFSVSAVGRLASALCDDDISPTGFGYDSPFHRLRETDAWIICMGVDLKAMTFVHHIEQTYGVPYGYTKEWTAPVARSGETVTQRFFAFVRYLDAGVTYDFSRLQDELLERGSARSARVGYGSVWAVRARDVFDLGMRRLKEDPFYFLEAPPTSEPWKK
jgi:aminoglycoside 3-N-acetyltransferase